jgi:hypothetical protein
VHRYVEHAPTAHSVPNARGMISVKSSDAFVDCSCGSADGGYYQGGRCTGVVHCVFDLLASIDAWPPGWGESFFANLLITMTHIFEGVLCSVVA